MVYERSYRMSGPVITAIGDHLWVGVPSWFLISELGQLSLISIWDCLIDGIDGWTDSALAGVRVRMSPLPDGS